MPSTKFARLIARTAVATMALAGCAGSSQVATKLPAANFVAAQEGPGEDYVIGPLDELTIFVWRNPELGARVQVRPDGRITTPLIQDIPAVGKTPSMLSEDNRHLSGTAAVGIDTINRKALDDVWTLSSQVGMRYTF